MLNLNKEEFLEYKSQTLTGIFLLFLAISGNFIGETFSCNLQRLLKTNMIAKHALLIIILYFSINFSGRKDSDYFKHPLHTLKSTFIIYSIFLLFTKMNIYFTIYSVFLLSILYILHDYIDYCKHHKKDKKYIGKLSKLSDIIIIKLLLIILVGFILYLSKQYKDHKENWSSIKFIFGIIKCGSKK